RRSLRQRRGRANILNVFDHHLDTVTEFDTGEKHNEIHQSRNRTAWSRGCSDRTDGGEVRAASLGSNRPYWALLYLQPNLRPGRVEATASEAEYDLTETEAAP